MSTHVLTRRWPWGLAALLAVLVFLASLVEIQKSRSDSRPVGGAEEIAALSEGEAPNILFVLVDTLRASRMSAYGYENPTTPFLEYFASRGVLFERHLAQSSWTKCSMASLWTGLYPSRTGVTRFDHALSEEAHMPAEILSEAGYRTIGIFRNGWVSGYFGFEQGFDVYVRPSARRLPLALRRENPTIRNSGSDMDAVETALEFLRLHGDDPWFLYLHLMDVHEYTYDEESALFGTSNSGIYDNSVLREDYVLETLFQQVDAMGHLSDTIIVIASDHGEAFGERGWEGHAREVHAETTEVPLLISLPFQLERGISIAQRTANVDIWPTLLDLAGLPALEESDGVSRVPEILAAARGEAQPDGPAQHFAYLDQSWGGTMGNTPQPSVAVVEDGLRYVRGRGVQGPPVEQLYDSRTDPLERADLSRERPEEVERLRESAKAHIRQKPSWDQMDPLEMDEMDLNQLRALGYALP